MHKLQTSQVKNFLEVTKLFRWLSKGFLQCGYLLQQKANEDRKLSYY
jgi:hypothetical protein